MLPIPEIAGAGAGFCLVVFVAGIRGVLYYPIILKKCAKMLKSIGDQLI
jgi:hypothetical protein